MLLAATVGKSASALSIESQNTLNTFCSSARIAAFSVRKSACALIEFREKGLAVLLVFSLLIIAGGELIRPLKMLDDRPGGPCGAPILVGGCPARSAARASGFCGVGA